MTTTAIADFSPVTESDVDPYGELFWTGEKSENLSQQWTEFVEKVFYEYGEESVYVNPATGEVIAHIDGAWRGWDEQDWEEICDQVSEFECDFDALDQSPKENTMKIFNSLAEMAEMDIFTDPDVMRDQPFTIDGSQECITYEEYEDLFSLVVDLVENIDGAEFVSMQMTPHHIIVVIAANGTRVTRVIRPVTPFVRTVTVKDGLTPETPSPSHCRCGVQSAPKHEQITFVPELRAIPELNYPYGPMAESHHYIARRAKGVGYVCAQAPEPFSGAAHGWDTNDQEEERND